MLAIISGVSAAWTFLTSPIGRVVGIGAVALLALVYADHRGAARVHKQWAAANVIAKAKADAMDAAAAERAAIVDKKDTAESDAADKANAEAHDAYVRELEKRAAGVCTISDADLKRLRDIK